MSHGRQHIRDINVMKLLLRRSTTYLMYFVRNEISLGGAVTTFHKMDRLI